MAAVDTPKIAAHISNVGTFVLTINSPNPQILKTFDKIIVIFVPYLSVNMPKGISNIPDTIHNIEILTPITERFNPLSI
ncbi:hypothetical protein JCM16774_1304 [Pseudoleptotrichia goodfellowii]|uniref:Uncharacterized protein n=1 Tax=Pseudoleptotrichia goodfellowii TaxID=157692 RepID=A0A510JAR7_9FUSO|nr:hypothetical protein JCM16774_1304 [Pseudoleptotrichia goodfellowii]